MANALSGALGVLLMVSSLTVVAGEAGPQAGQFYIAPLGAYYDLSGDLGFDDGETGPGIAVGYAFHEQWAAELSYFRFEGEFDVPGGIPSGSGSEDADVDALWANLLWFVPVKTDWQPYTTVGIGRTSYDFGSFGDEDETEINFGLGAFVDISPRMAFRGDVRGVYLTDAEDLVPFVSLGLSVALGRIEPAAQPDADGDGVPDPSDQCPGTPSGRQVDGQGCELDSDNDGVVDGLDACPDTPAGAQVDARGCPLDGDGDGVPDFRDDCPDSEAGAKVDTRGCYVELEESVTISMNVEFGSDSDSLGAEYRAEVDKVVDFLRQYPTSHAVIEGHTDNTGAAGYNQKLSERRALAVLDALVVGGVDPDRLSAIGYGEDRPMETNETTAGRQRNRRVDAVVSGSRTVRQ